MNTRLCCVVSFLIADWQLGPDMPGKGRANFATAVVSKTIYLFGGIDCDDDDGIISPVLGLDTSTAKWSVISQMPTPRYNLAATSYENTIIVLGGCDIGNDPVNTTEMFSDIQSWHNATSMPSPRCALAAVTVGSDVYVIGGYKDDYMTSTLSSVDVFSFSTGKWRSVAAMNIPRWGHGAVAFNGKIYVAGGCNKDSLVAELEMYDPTSNTWKNLVSLNKPRYNFGVALAGPKMFVIGGTSDFRLTSMTDVEVYDADNNDIDHVKPMTGARFSLGAASIGQVVYAIGGVHTIAATSVASKSVITPPKLMSPNEQICDTLVEEYTSP